MIKTTKRKLRMMQNLLISSFLIIVLSQNTQVSAQDNRTQYPPMLLNSFFEVNIGYINYPFSDLQMLPGYTAESIHVPHTAVRIIPYGYKINQNLSVQISYMRPVLWVRYRNVNGDNGNHPVFMNVGGLTIKRQIPISDNFRIYGEGGLGVVTRAGFSSSTPPHPLVMEDANYASFLFGAGIKYQPNKKWGFMLSTAYTPPHSNTNQPHTVFYSGGFAFNMFRLPDETVEANANTKYIFPRNMIQIAYTTNAFGYGVNEFFSQGMIPVFWGGNAEIEKGISISYQRNIFHGLKHFFIDWGLSYSHFTTNINDEKFWTLSLFPVYRFTILHTRPADFYLNYSLAGPTFISGLMIDGYETGPRFTFQDFMGMGCYIGEKRIFNAEIKIVHYSNGNLFPQNDGIKIPLTFNLGYTF